MPPGWYGEEIATRIAGVLALLWAAHLLIDAFPCARSPGG